MNLPTLVLLGQMTFKGFSRDNCSQMAAAIAYHILFALVPLGMFIVAALGLLIGSDTLQERIKEEVSQQLGLGTVDVSLELTPEGRARIESTYGAEALFEIETELAELNEDDDRVEERGGYASTLNQGGSITIEGYTLTPADVSIDLDNIVLETIESVVAASGTVGVISLLFLAYAASGLMGVVRRALDFVWDTPRHAPMVAGKLIDVALLFAIIILVMTALLLLVALSIASTVFFQVIGANASWLESALWSAVGLFLPMLFSFTLFMILYRYGPHTRNTMLAVWPGAVLAAVGFEVLKFGYSIYIREFASFDVIYGALGGVLLFLLFVYLSAQLFLFGAELSAEYPRVMRGDYAAIASEPAPPTTLREKVTSFIRSFFVSTPPP